MIRQKLASNLYAYRKYNKLSQEKLSKKSKIDRTQIGNIENDRVSSTIDMVEKLAISLKTDPCLLLARPMLQMPGTGIKKQTIIPTFFTEGVAAYAFWTDKGMEFHPIASGTFRNQLHMMALIQANGVTGKDLLSEFERLHIPYKDYLR